MAATDVLEWRLGQLEDDRKRLAEAIESLVKLEENHRRTWEAIQEKALLITDVEVRVRELENSMPLLKMTSHWVIVGVLGILSLVGMSAYRMIFAS